MPIYLDGLGTVQAFNTVTVRARVDGELKKVSSGRSGRESGDVLALIDPRPLPGSARSGRRKKGQDEAQLANAQATLARNTDLLAKKVIDPAELRHLKVLGRPIRGPVQADQPRSTARKRSSIIPRSCRRSTAAPAFGWSIRAISFTPLTRAASWSSPSSAHLGRFHAAGAESRAVLNQGGDKGGLPVLALDRDNTTPLGEGTLAVVDNESTKRPAR